jgi:pyridoxal/pyridoxine/pyridoxamine kinase
MRDFTTHTEKGTENSIKCINAHLSTYLNGGRSLFLELGNQIKGNCDIVLDGHLTVDELAATIYKRLRQQQSPCL